MCMYEPHYGTQHMYHTYSVIFSYHPPFVFFPSEGERQK